MEHENADELTLELLNYLKSIQNADGSFDTLCLQPAHRPLEGWFRYFGNAPHDVAQTGIPLLFLRHPLAEDIIKNINSFILRQSLDGLLWRYPCEGNHDVVPYDTDSVSLCSYFLEKQGYEVRNKKFLLSLITDENYFPFYIYPKRFSPHLPLLTNLKLWWFNRKVPRSTNYVNKGLALTDAEFCSTCVNLMYLGDEESAKSVWERIHRDFREMDIKYLYYIDHYRAFYFYARLYGYNKNYPVTSDVQTVSNWVNHLYGHGALNAMDAVLLANGMLLFNYTPDILKSLTKHIFTYIHNKEYRKPYPFYSSNAVTDYAPMSGKPHSYFGSPAITTALFLEFLRLYKSYT
ncbi:MAG: hypothetical protein NZM35_05895, partial [Chitinophagales bacterium]|nr:hypothetical protein [Chitinophagales bacterium]